MNINDNENLCQRTLVSQQTLMPTIYEVNSYPWRLLFVFFTHSLSFKNLSRHASLSLCLWLVCMIGRVEMI